MDYRREIDGLRALAVLPVIFFHCGFQTFSGGFVGVDVFFVISGYLITSVIIAEKQAGTFTLINFYERRARRILPALFIVMFACLPFAWLWLIPSDMKDFSRSLVAVSGFASNVLFWRTSGYFDATAELKPLLHTWSLAVEEQYYLFFPIFLMLTWRLRKRWILSMLFIVAVVSLAATQWGSVNEPIATFYLLPTRGWELLIGVFIAFYFCNQGNPDQSSLLNQLGGAIGFLLIIYAIFAFDKQTPFPSSYTLIPTIGAGLIISFSTRQTLVGKLLGNKCFVGLGLISYSAYLWHYPLLAFAKHRSVDEPSKLLLAMLAAASVMLAYFSWKYVETPFRSKQRFDRNRVFLYGAAGSIFFIVIGLFGHFTKGYISRFDSQSLRYLMPNKVEGDGCVFQSLNEDSAIRFCYFGDPVGKKSFLLYGDSHSVALLPELDIDFRQRQIRGIRVYIASCEAIPETVTENAPSSMLKSLATCKASFNKLISYFEDSHLQALDLPEITKMKLLTTSNSELMEVTSIRTEGAKVIVSGTIMGAMPIQAMVSGTALRKRFDKMSLGTLWQIFKIFIAGKGA